MKQYHLNQARTVLASWKPDLYPQLIPGAIRSWSDILTSASVLQLNIQIFTEPQHQTGLFSDHDEPKQ